MVDKSEKVVWAARLGYMVRGLVYALFGYLALAAGHADEANAGTQGSLEYLQDIPGGSAVLFICAFGLLGYAIYKIIAAVFDTEHAGKDVQGYARRLGWAGSFVVYCILAWTAFKLGSGLQQDTGGSTQSAVKMAFAYGPGSIVIGIAGLAMLIGGVDQFRRAWTASFMQRMSSHCPSMTCHIGRIGYAARGVVFLLVGWSLIRSAWMSDGSRARSVGQALMDLKSMDITFALIATGLIFFGAFSMITARYQIIPDPDPHPNR